MNARSTPEPIEGWQSDVIRSPGDYVRVAGIWYPTVRRIKRFEHDGTLAVEPSVVGGQGPAEVSVGEIDLAARVAPTCEYRGLPFTVATVSNEEGRRIASPVPSGDHRYSAKLHAKDSDAGLAAQLHGASHENAWADDPGVSVTVAVTELTGYRDHADVRPILDFEEPDWGSIFPHWAELRMQIEAEIGRRAESAHLGGEGLANFDPRPSRPRLGFKLGPSGETVFTVRDARPGIDVATPDLEELYFRVFEYWTRTQALRHPDDGPVKTLQAEYLARIEPGWAKRLSGS